MKILYELKALISINIGFSLLNKIIPPSRVLFSNIGNPIDLPQNIKFIKNIKIAANKWKDPQLIEANNVAWESFESKLIHDEDLKIVWEKAFYNIKPKILEFVGNSKNINIILENCNQTLDEFCLQLPFLGAFGETIASSANKDFNGNFFRSQIPYYMNGHWICGWEGKITDYPKQNFYII